MSHRSSSVSDPRVGSVLVLIAHARTGAAVSNRSTSVSDPRVGSVLVCVVCSRHGDAAGVAVLFVDQLRLPAEIGCDVADCGFMLRRASVCHGCV